MIRTSANRPRLSVFRSAKYIYGQIIDDKTGKTLAAANDKDLITKKPATQKARKKTGSTEVSVPSVLQGKYSKTERARLVGKLLAEKAVKEKIKEVVFDRGRFKYHGRVKALAEGAREGGLKF